MKRKTAISFWAILAFVFVAYAVWCARPFYLAPRIYFRSGVPVEAQAAAREWYRENGHKLQPRPFDFALWGYSLAHPFEDLRQPLSVEPDPRKNFSGETVILVDRNREWVFERDLPLTTFKLKEERQAR